MLGKAHPNTDLRRTKTLLPIKNKQGQWSLCPQKFKMGAGSLLDETLGR